MSPRQAGQRGAHQPRPRSAAVAAGTAAALAAATTYRYRCGRSNGRYAAAGPGCGLVRRRRQGSYVQRMHARPLPTSA
mgnify:CR=1 FL=1